jgi:hypothetical protein
MRGLQCWVARRPGAHLARAKNRRIPQFGWNDAGSGAGLVATMSRSGMNGSNGPRGPGMSRTYYGTMLLIVLLLVCWFVIGHWNQLPQLIDSTMAALP